jgi:hypothetical protein
MKNKDLVAKAVVEECQQVTSDQITPSIRVNAFHLEARMQFPGNQYSDNIYMVRVIKPEGVGNLIDERGTLMEHGKFSFDSTEAVTNGTELEIEISRVG